jgi:hypothetical protein
LEYSPDPGRAKDNGGILMSYDYEDEFEYHYDIGYYEGVRNILQIINRSLGNSSIKESERIDVLLKLVGEELDDAKKSHKNSENRLYN